MTAITSDRRLIAFPFLPPNWGRDCFSRPQPTWPKDYRALDDAAPEGRDDPTSLGRAAGAVVVDAVAVAEATNLPPESAFLAKREPIP